MSTDHESGFTGSAGERPSDGPEAAGQAPGAEAPQAGAPAAGHPVQQSAESQPAAQQPDAGSRPTGPDHAGSSRSGAAVPPSGQPQAVPEPPPYAPHAEYAPGSPYAASSGPAGPGAPQDPHGAAPWPAASPWGVPGQAPGQPKGREKRGGVVALLAAVAIAAGAVGGGVGTWVAHRDDTGMTSSTVSTSVNPKALNRAPTSVAGIAARALPSTVTIKAQGQEESGTGTGFVYDTQGHILTNNHVVAPAANGGKLTVKLSDGSSYTASVVGRAQGYDVAVIKLDNPPRHKLKPLPLGNSDAVAVGDATIAIGAPFGLEGTVTTGIVSAKNRPVASGDSAGGQTSYMNALQTDASINPGNSGGPLLNASGQVIGINSAIQSTGNNSNPFGGSSQSGSIGLGFAIPINQARWVADTLIRTGRPVYAIIGVLRNDDYQGDGAQIMPSPVQGMPAVTPGGPAAKAGLKPGDVITRLDGVPIDSGPTLVSEIWSHRPGDAVKVQYLRDGQQHSTTVVLGERSGDN